MNHEEKHCYSVQSALTIYRLPENIDSRKTIITNIFSKPDVCMFDLSESNINDDDMSFVFVGFVNREMKLRELGKPVGIQLLNLNNNYISRKGVKRLLILLQKGMKCFINEREEIVYPNIREMIIKVSVDVNVTEELVCKWHRKAPRVFKNGVTIVE